MVKKSVLMVPIAFMLAFISVSYAGEIDPGLEDILDSNPADVEVLSPLRP